MTSVPASHMSKAYTLGLQTPVLQTIGLPTFELQTLGYQTLLEMKLFNAMAGG